MPFTHRLLVVLAVVVALALSGAAVAGAAETRVTLAGVQAVAWMPEGGAHERAPVIVFSHAFGLCPTQARFLTGALAGAGYLVIAPYHADSACDFGVDLANPSRLPLKPAGLWSDADYRDRAENVREVLRALPADPILGPRADVQRVGLVGHSLGGYTVLGLAGAWPSWATPEGVRAAVAMSPYTLPLLANGSVEALRVPVMFQGGTQDPAFTWPLTSAGGAYTRAPAPKVMVEVAYGTHLAWTDVGLFGRDAIVATALAFLDHHLRGAPERPELRGPTDGVESLVREPPAASAPPVRRADADRALGWMREWMRLAREWRAF